jgi:TM2 domain-containing membrane protein YozV
MRGQILSYSPETGDGLIAGSDGKRYAFKGIEYRGRVFDIRPGQEVDFEPHEDGTATAIFPLAAPVGAISGAKSKIAAGLLAIFLGSFGIHKFYLGYTGAAVTMLLVTLLTCGFGSIIMGPIALIEGIIYLTNTDEAFEQTYVRNTKSWF